jgi:hypothetical protein
MKSYLKRIKDLLGVKCTHRKAMFENCKYCPDCGKKVVTKWALIRCEFCGHYRKAMLDVFGGVKPKAKYCFYCGSDRWRAQNYYRENIPDSLKALSVIKVETEALKFGSLTERTRVWISRLR